MTIRKNVIVAAGLAGVLSGFSPAFAQFDMPDPEMMVPGDEALVIDLDILANLPMEGDFMAALPIEADFIAGPAGGPPGPASGKCPLPPPGKGGCGPFGFLQGDFALTDEQYEKLYNLRNQFLDQAGPKFLALKEAERDLRDQMTKPQLDRNKLKEIQSKINKDKADLANLKLDKKMNALEVLTEEQRKEIRRQAVRGGFGMRARGHHGKFSHHKG